jgi:hypothetical protein
VEFVAKQDYHVLQAITFFNLYQLAKTKVKNDFK